MTVNFIFYDGTFRKMECSLRVTCWLGLMDLLSNMIASSSSSSQSSIILWPFQIPLAASKKGSMLLFLGAPSSPSLRYRKLLRILGLLEQAANLFADFAGSFSLRSGVGKRADSAYQEFHHTRIARNYHWYAAKTHDARAKAYEHVAELLSDY